MSKLKKLKFLDCYEITEEEKNYVQSNESSVFDVVKVKVDSNSSNNKKILDSLGGSAVLKKYTPLSQTAKNQDENEDKQGQSMNF